MSKCLKTESLLIIFIRFKKYGAWFFINFVFAMLPFLIMFARNYTRESMFSNFLSFNFGLLVSSLYALYIALDSKVEKEDKSFFLFIVTFFWIVLIDSAYVIYPDIPNIYLSNLFETNLVYITITILIVSIIISLLLNKPSIERSINESRATRKMVESQDIKDDFKNISQKLEMDGI